jgi:capsule polysaccharide export protein KpsE/RkpR
LSNIRELIALKSEKLKELEGNGDDNNPNIVILRIAISKLKTELERSLEEAVGNF